MSADGRYGLVLKEKHVARVVAHACSRLPHEAGGALVGCYTRDLRVAIVKKVLCLDVPSGTDGGTHYVRNGPRLTGLLARIWRMTLGRRYYLGEWHSHPGGAATPSGLDRAEMTAIAATPEEECSAPVLLVVGRDFAHGAAHFGAFVFPRTAGTVPLRSI